TGIFDDAYDDRDEGAEVDYNNLETMELKKFTQSLEGESWVEAMQEELLYFKGHRQEEGIDYDKVFAPVARIEAIRLFLDYASFMDFNVHQIDVKGAFLYGTIEEELYVSQPPGFVDPQFPDKVYKAAKALHVKRIFRYLKGHPTLGLWYPKDSPLELIAYSDSDYACASLDRKSTTGGYFINTTNGHQFTMSNRQERIGYSRENGNCSKTFNSIKQIHAIVDGKAVVISESLVRSDILFDDEDGITCLTNDEIFKNLALTGYEPFSTKLTFQKAPTEHILQSPTTYQQKRKTQTHRRTQKDIELPQTVPQNLKADKGVNYEEGGRPRYQETIRSISAQTRSERVLEQPLTEGYTSGSGEGRLEENIELIDNVPTPHDSPLTGGYTPGSDEGRITLAELMETCTILSNKVTQLETELLTTKFVYNKAFITLTNRVKKLESQLKQKKSRVVIRSLDKEGPSVHIEDSLKQERIIEALDKNENINFISGQGENRPFSKAEVKKNMIMYLKNPRGYKQSYFKGIKYEDIKPLFERIWDQFHTFIPNDSKIEREVMKRARFDLQQGSSKKQRLDQQIEETKEEARAQAIPLAVKPLVIIDYKIIKEGKISTYQITRADRSTRRYTSMINLLENIDREDLETLWKLVKDKYGNTRPEEGYERVLWGDLKVMFELDIESEVWRQLQGYDVTAWKLFSLCGVYFVRFKNLHIFLLVDKVYPLTPATINDVGKKATG
nr:copia protein [Tanacetum cinerariifolium]